ncbi:hypothetical protein ENBRE01_1740 [Enteropsectra breve]|nr:hypothetical protein ENBRE01_1740 [Enteropsectra breve]
MKIFSGLHFVCVAFAKLETYGQKRLFEDHFRIEVLTGDGSANYDLRDLLRFDFVEWALKGHHIQGGEFGARVEKQLAMHAIYEDALATINCSTDDTIAVYENLINQELTKSENYEFFENPSDPAEAIELPIPFTHEIIHIMCQLTSGWCTDSIIPLNDDNVITILQAATYLLVNRSKLVDIFMKENGAPLHMRIKTIDLFCINFVYHLEKNGLLSKYKILLKNTDNNLNEKDNTISMRFNRMGKIIMSYVHLLEIEMDGEHVNKLFLRAGSRYFAYEPHYRPECKVIVFKHKEYINYTLVKLDLIAELNTINKTMENRRLDIQLPFFDGFSLNPYSRLKEFPSVSFIEDFYRYLDLMEILPGLQEVYIYNLLPYYKTMPSASESGEFLDNLFVKMVEAVLLKLDKLSSLFIQGFVEFPPELIPRLQEKSLRKFGAMGFCGKIDYLVIHQLFSKECSLKRSINHFIGHCRAVQLFFQITKRDNLEEATIYNRLFKLYDVLPEADRLYSEQIKEYFVGGNLNNAIINEQPLNISTVYLMEPIILMKGVVLKASRDGTQWVFIINEVSKEIAAKEFLSGSVIRRLVIRQGNNLHTSRDFIITAVKRIPAFNTAEIVINTNKWSLLEYLELNKIRNHNRELSLIINVDARTMMYGKSKMVRGEDSTYAIYDVFSGLLKHNDKNIKLKVKVRRMGSIKVDHDYARNKFIEYCKNEYSWSDENAISKLFFEEIPYDSETEYALRSVHL